MEKGKERGGEEGKDVKEAEGRERNGGKVENKKKMQEEHGETKDQHLHPMSPRRHRRDETSETTQRARQNRPQPVPGAPARRGC